MDKVRRNREVFPEIGIFLYQAQNAFSAAIAVFPYQTVIFGVLTEFFDCRCDYYKLSAVGDRHSRAIYRLVSEPCRSEFLGAEIDHRLFYRLVKMNKIQAAALTDGTFKCRAGLSDVYSVKVGLFVLTCGNGKNIYKREIVFFS